MNGISQKCQYALRALFELAKRFEQGYVSVPRIAEAQAIPAKFLETILGRLRQAGLVVSRRGVDGGYSLARRPEDLTVGEVVRLVEGPLGPVECLAEGGGTDCPFHGGCAFLDMWRRAHDAGAAVYDETTFRDLLETGANASTRALNFSI